MKIYASWINKIFEDEDAINTLKSSELISGMELSGGNDDILALEQKDIRLSIHTPGRTADYNLINPEFVSNMQNNMQVFDNSELATFHMISRMTEMNGNNPQNIKKNLLFCCNSFGNHRVAFETTIFHPKFAPIEITDPEFIKGLIQSTGSGIVFDTSHAFITAIRREMVTKEPAREYLRRLIDASAGKVYEMHFNVPTEIDGSMTDTHGICKENDPTSDAIISLASKVLQANPNMKIMTLEMNTHTTPKEHAKIMCEQAEMISKKLGIKERLKR